MRIGMKLETCIPIKLIKIKDFRTPYILKRHVFLIIKCCHPEILVNCFTRQITHQIYIYIHTTILFAIN